MPAPGGVLRVRPCGACGAYVDALDGCAHWRPARVRRRTTGPRAVSPLESRMGMMMLWGAPLPRSILAAAHEAGAGGVDVGPERVRCQAARRMAMRGLLVQAAPRSRWYAITDAGRQVQARLLEMDAGRF